MEPFKITEVIIPEKWDKKTIKNLRKEKYVPAQIYGKGINNIYFGIKLNVVEKILHLKEFTTFVLQLNGQEYPAVLQELQRNPLTDTPVHIDFVLLRNDKKYIITLPVKLTGTPVGVVKGGTLVQNLKYIRVKCSPQFFLPFYEIDVSKLDIGNRLHIKEIAEKDKDRIILHPPHLLVARIPGMTKPKTEQVQQQST